MCSFEVSETQFLLLFSKVASAVSVISNQKRNVNFIYFHTLLYEKIKKGNGGTTEIVTIKKVDLNPLLCIKCKRTLITCILSAQGLTLKNNPVKQAKKLKHYSSRKG